jgi:hypothetical protein
MSGPKAFRIVTRAEIISICRRNLARLDAAIEIWTSSCQRNGTIDQTDIDKVIARRDELRRLLDADRFTELQKQVAVEISYLQADVDRRAEKAAEEVVRRKRDLRRTKDAAQALLARLESSGIDVPSDIRRELATQTESSDRLNTAIGKGLLLLQPTDKPQGTTDRQRDLANRLGASELRTTLEEWMSKQPHTDDEALVRVDVLLGELKGLGIDPNPFSARIAALESETPARKALVADSLLLDLAASVKNGRDRARAVSELLERRAELSEMKSPEAASLLAEIDQALAGSPASSEPELIVRADFLIEAEVRALASEERRRAVLEGLASLGYEVSEGMATAWVRDGRVVLRKAANPGYGVELSGGSQSDLLQVRAVGIGNPTETRDMSRDRDMETIWCGEFQRLQSLVGKSGGSLSLESARPVGQFPLKVIPDLGGSHVADDVATTRHLLR